MNALSFRSFVPACLAILAAAPAVQAQVVTRVALLSGMQQVPPLNVAGFGCGRFVIDTAANTVSYRITVGGLTSAETAAHIHGVSGPGVNSGVVHTLPAGPVKVGIWTYAPAQEADLLNGNMYVNVHTALNGGGELRGQIVTHVATLDGVQESPPNGSPARGFGLFNMDRGANTLSYYIAFAGLPTAEIDAHIHGPARHGVNAGVAHPLPAGSPKVGVWNYPVALEEQILFGMFYVNIHSVAVPGGEIRGQIVSSVNPLDGQQEVPANASTATGCGLVTLDQGAGILSYDVMRTAFGSAEAAAHIHGFSAPGVNSGVQVNLAAPGAVRKLGSWTYGAANESNVLAGLSYFNIHTMAFGGGEIRGQIECAKPLASAVAYGAGCIGPGGLLSLTTNLPWTGRTFTATATGFGPVSLGLMNIGIGAAGKIDPGVPLAVAPVPGPGAGCSIHAAVHLLENMTPPLAGTQTWSVNAPDFTVDPSWIGLEIHLQAVELDFSAGWVGTYTSNGVTAVFAAL